MQALRGICGCLDLKFAHANAIASQSSSLSFWCGRIISVITCLPQAFFNWVHTLFAQAAPPLVRKPRTFCLISGHVPGPNLVEPQLDPAMLKLQQFISNLSVLIGNSLYTHFIQPALQNSQTISQDVLAKWNSLAAMIATACANEIIASFDDALSTIDSKAKALLSWLLHGSNSTTVQSDLVTSLEDKFSNLSHDFLTNFVSAISDVKWLTSSDAASADAPASADPGILKTVLTSILQKLIQDKIQALISNACTSIQSTLLSDLPPAIQNNCQIIGDLVTTRFATLIQTTSPINPAPDTLTLYQQGYDHIVDLIYKQTEAVIKVGADIQQFCQQDICDPAIKQMLNPPTGVDQAAYQTQVEQAESLQFANDFIPLLLPDQRTVQDGFTTTIPGIILLLGELQLPASIVTFIQNFLKWPDDLFPNGPPASAQTVFNSAVYFMQQGLAAILNAQIETGLGIGLNLGMNMVVPPVYLTMWMVKGAFPALFPALVKALFTVRINDAGHTLSDRFLPLAASDCNRPSLYQTLIPYLQGTLQDMCKQVPFSDVGITPDVFASLLTPVLDDIADFLQKG